MDSIVREWAYDDRVYRTSPSGVSHIVRDYPSEKKGPVHLAVRSRKGSVWAYCGLDITAYREVPSDEDRICGTCIVGWHADDD